MAQPIWFAPKGGNAPVRDFWALFDPASPWTSASSRIAVFSMPLPTQSAQVEKELPIAFAALRQRKIDLSLGIGPLSGGSSGDSPRHCGYHVEGYSAPAGFIGAARWVRSLVSSQDSSKWMSHSTFGHTYEGSNACHSSIAEIAEDIAKKVQQFKSVFPNVGVGDVEPIMGFPENRWFRDVEQFVNAFRTATGQPLAFFRLDIGWDGPWRDRVARLGPMLREKGISLQVIYNGNARNASGRKWIEQAMQHATDFERVVTPDAVVVQCWTRYPDHLLPESDPDALTYLVNRYADWKEQH
jgi:hypothetical protein